MISFHQSPQLFSMWGYERPGNCGRVVFKQYGPVPLSCRFSACGLISTAIRCRLFRSHLNQGLDSCADRDALSALWYEPMIRSNIGCVSWNSGSTHHAAIRV
jgi:hypothetical protein